MTKEKIVRLFNQLIVLSLLMVLVACGEAPVPATLDPDQVNIVAPTTNVVAPPAPALTVRVLPTIYPTQTPLATRPPTPTSPPIPTTIPPTNIPFDSLAIALRYRIPSLNLDRRFEATVASQITLTDEVTGETVTLTNQSPALIELQSYLPSANLLEMPADCTRCVYLEYSMPLAGYEGRGWLQDTRILSGIENFMTFYLDPPYPPDAVLGLWQGFSIYNSTQMVALTAEGTLWQWSVLDNQVAEPISVAIDMPALLSPLVETPLRTRYQANCFGEGRETLSIKTNDTWQHINIICPELTLPTTLVPLYKEMLGLLSPPDETEIAQPIYPLSLDTLLFYQRYDGMRLHMDSAGEVLITNARGDGVRTLNLTSSEVMSLTNPLLAEPILAVGATALQSTESEEVNGSTYATDNVLALRHKTGVSTAGWNDTPTVAWAEAMAPLNALLDESPDLLPTATITATTIVTGTASP